MKVTLLIFIVLIAATSAFPSWNDGPKCIHPNGEGLQHSLEEMHELIPTEKLLEIYLISVTSDEDVAALMEFITSDEFIKLLITIHNVPELRRVLTESCDVLYFDAEYVLNIFGGFLGWPQIPPSHILKKTTRNGLKSMFDQILAVLPLPQLKEIFYEKLENDQYAIKGINLLKSNDFRSMVKLVLNSSQYKHIESELRRAELDVDAVLAFLKEHLGWSA